MSADTLTVIDNRTGKQYEIPIQDGAIRANFRKHHRPNYGVFDENRLYLEGPISGPVEIAGCRVGFPICEDIWFPDVAEAMQEAGAEILISPNGSPYERGKHDIRMHHAVARSVETGLPLVYLNLTGGLGAASGSQGHARVPTPKAKRFSINYHLLALREGAPRVRVQVWVDDGETVPTVVPVWPTADWHEREAWDLFGIQIEGHPNPTRILMDEDWEGHPLRKDYPLGGEPVRFTNEE